MKRTLLLLLLFIVTACAKEETAKKVEVSLRLIFPPELSSMMQSLDAAAKKASIKLELTGVHPAAAAGKIASGEIKTEAWLTPLPALVDYTNSKIVNLGARQTGCQTVFSTPVVIGAQERFILNFKDRARYFSWQDFFDVSTADPSGGIEKKVSYVVGMLDRTVSGLPTFLQLLYFAGGAKDKKVERSVFDNPEAMERYKSYINNISYYAPTEDIVLDKASVFHGHLFFAFSTERQLILFNQNEPLAAKKLYALYPAEGSIWLDYNLCLSDADWVIPPQKAAFKELSQYMLSDAFQREVISHGFRPARADLEADLSSFQNNGAVAANLDMPKAEIGKDLIGHLFENSAKLHRPAAAVYLIDISGTTTGHVLSAGKRMMRALLANAHPENLSSLISFAEETTIWSQFTADHSDAIKMLDRLEASGGSSLYDAVAQSIRQITQDKLKPYRRNLYIFTDGNDNKSSMSLDTLLDLIKETRRHYDINVEIVALAEPGTNLSDIERIAQAFNANLYKTTLEGVDKIISNLISAF